MAALIVVTGPPGAGKSTASRILAGRFDPSALVAGDDFFGFLAKGAIPPWLPEAAKQNRTVIDASGAAAGRLVDGGYTVVFDGMVGPWLLASFLEMTGLPRLHYVVLLPSERECVDRVRARAGHGFTDEEATRHMHREFARSGLDPRHLVVGPPDPRSTAATIAERVRQGALEHCSR